MQRKNIGPVNGLYPALTTIVGVDVAEKPNWITIAHVGIMNHGAGDFPQYLSVGLNRSHYSNLGIREHREFSINIATREMMDMTDYVGMVSGSKVDKSELFPVERGELTHAPMIGSCPLSMELKLEQIVELGHHEVFIGELVSTYVDEDILTDGKPDLIKIDPLLFDFMQIDYLSLGERTGKPWREGMKIKKSL